MNRMAAQSVTHAVVLAGGLGTRLAPVLRNQPKVLAPVAGRTFLDWKLDEFVRNGITKVTFLLGHGSGPVMARLHRSEHPLTIETTLDGPEPLGTGGALLNIIESLHDDFFLTYGDSLLDMPYTDLINARDAQGVPNALAVTTHIGPADHLNCLVSDGLVRRHDKQEESSMTAMDYGLMILNPLSLASESPPLLEELDLSVLIDRLAGNRLLAAHVTDYSYWEIGTPVSLDRTGRHLAQLMVKESRRAGE